MQLIFKRADGQVLNFAEEHSISYPNQRYAIVKHVPDRGDAMQFYPDAVHMQDRPIGDGVGHSIPVLSSWWSYIRKINNDAGYAYATTSQAMWINLPGDPRPIDIQSEKTNCESIITGGAFVAFDDETATHIRLVAFDYRMNTSVLDPNVNNWFYEPWRFWKPVSIRQDGTLNKVANGVDVYFPLLKYTELWIGKSQVEFFPAGNYDYRLRGTDVYDGATPLMTVAKNMQRTFYRNDWRLETVGVIPPA